MPNDQQKNLQPFLDRYEKLPQALKDAIFAEATADKIFEIGEKHHLMIDKVGALASETGMVMLGVSHPKDFIRNLAEALGVDNEKAREIAGDVNEQIFQPVREHIKKLYGMADAEPESVPPPLTPSLPPLPSAPLQPPPPPKKEDSAAAAPKAAQAPASKEGFVFQEKLHEVQREKPETIDVGLPSERASSFEDLRRELRKTIERDHSTQKTQQPAPYKGADPYKEPIE